MSSVPLQAGDRITLRLESLAVGGEAVGRYEGMAVFALQGCPGDLAEVEITEVSRSFARGVVCGLVEPSPDRIEPVCPHFGVCGGCQLQHISYRTQLSLKRDMVLDSLARIAGLDQVETREIWGMESPWHYRNRAQYHAAVSASGEVVLGFLRRRSHENLALSECRVQHPLAEQIRISVEESMRRVAQGAAERRALLEVETLISFSTEKGIATLVCEGKPAFVESLARSLMERTPKLSGVLFARRRGRSVHRSPAELVVGEGHIVEEVAGEKYLVSADSFFQSNPKQAGKMVELAREWAAPKSEETVADLYCGVGTFLLPLAKMARRGIGVEESRSAVQDARVNAREWGLRRISFYERKVERALPKLVARGQRAQVVTLDPPRKGCGPIVLGSAVKLTPSRILLISCHPATFARDAKTLAGLGYKLRAVQPLDMFPHTWHVETMGIFEKA